MKKFTYIVWQDSWGVTTEWEDIAEASKYEPVICHSVGIIIKETKKAITLCPNMTEEDKPEDVKVLGCISIPKVSIMNKRSLK